MKNYLLLPAALLLAACGQPEEAAAPATEPAGAPEAAAETASPEPAAEPAPASLEEILAAQPEDVQARYEHRHPQETLEFFGIEPGMTVVEALPGGGWYTKILLPYLGADGRVIGADYALEMFPLFGFFSDEQIKKKETWVEDWTAQAEGWAGDDGAAVSAFVLGSLPEEMKGTADAMLFIRALHNLARFEDEGGYLTAALADAYAVLKPGGVVGVVQHEARPDMPDEWADGSAGYLKQAFVINAFEEAGFELAAESDINANPADQPTAEDVVWRLPPTLATSREDPELREQLQAVGESNRMTLLFRKPAE
ncbi:class I SAM-dependent methyltransferase [Lentisalinibacter orientalis]|uniref:class I SAM-dependent methyltransferase n=1 Tax=Lentisalinibacter orientalis TaxID=2992241 RepID=UPI003867DA68